MMFSPLARLTAMIWTSSTMSSRSMDAIALVEMTTSPCAGNVRAVAHALHVQAHVPARENSFTQVGQLHSHWRAMPSIR